MKPKETEKKYTAREIAESVIFPSSLNSPEREKSLDAFRQFRTKSEAKRTPENKRIAGLLELKFLIEDYLKKDYYNKEYHFGYFLKEYINRINKKNKDFAYDVDIDPTELSQILNQHRYPSEKLIRLEIHSNKNFPALMWFNLVEKEKAFELVYNNKIRETEKKHVKEILEFSL